MPEEEQKKSLRVLPSDIAADITAGRSIDLLDILAIADGSQVQIYVFGTDALSGARGYAASNYTATDIVEGRFQKKSFEIRSDERDSVVGP